MFRHSPTHILNAVCLLFLLAVNGPIGRATTEGRPYIHQAQAQMRQAQLAEINSYVTDVKRFTNRSTRNRRIFADVAASEDNNSKWREFKTKREFDKFEGGWDESAFAWTRSGKAVAAAFTFTSQSGDWVHGIMYYFREDGTLAKLEAQLNTFHGEVSVLRNQYFDKSGVSISSTQRILDLYTKKPVKKPDYFDNPVTVFKKVSDLPFYKLL